MDTRVAAFFVNTRRSMNHKYDHTVNVDGKACEIRRHQIKLYSTTGILCKQISMTKLIKDKTRLCSSYRRTSEQEPAGSSRQGRRIRQIPAPAAAGRDRSQSAAARGGRRQDCAFQFTTPL